jgi:hypothetical protein
MGTEKYAVVVNYKILYDTQLDFDEATEIKNEIKDKYERVDIVPMYELDNIL